MHSVVLHSHFYQPPREDPWLEEIKREPDAEPYHDWTTRVAHECYRGVVAARVLDGEGRVRRVVNTLAYTSFDAAPSLLGWLERHMPNAHRAVLAADRDSLARLGRGNALAHPYDHLVLPLASRRDKVTTVRWGIVDFERRFGRLPDGMWLPETAVDDETLDVLAEQGIRFTVLAPHQVTGAPADGAPGLYTTSNGRTIAICTYDGRLSHEIAFGGLLRDGRKLAEQLAAGTDDSVVAVATDGETYGHHHRFGDMALAAAIDVLERHPRARLENYASVLGRRPATQPVGIVERSAWSCAHGVERWRSACGCAIEPGTHQRWRAPLREAIDGLVSELDALYEREGPAVLGGDPWRARDAYANTGVFPAVDAHAPPGPDEVRARTLLEMERHLLRAQTSGAWFGDDVARPEGLIVLRAAARALELARAIDPELAGAAEGRMLDRLGRAESNDAAARTARDLYLQRARPQRPPAVRVAAGYAAARRFGADHELPSAWSAIGAEDHLIHLIERRTGRTWTFDVLVDVPGSPAAAHHARSGRTPPHPHTAVAEEHHGHPGHGHPGHGHAGHGHPERGAPIRLADVDPRAITVLVRELPGAGAPEAAPLGTALKLPDLPQRARRAVEGALRRAVVHRLLDADERERLAAGEAELGALVSAALRRAVRALATDTSPPAIARVLGLADLRDSLRGVPPFDAQTLFHEIRLAAPPEAAARLAPVARRLGFSPRAWDATWREAPGLGTREPAVATFHPVEPER